MRHLLVALSAFAFLLQVVPAYSGGKKCWNKSGTCRKHCKDGEAIKEACRRRRMCCVPASKIRSQESLDKQLPKTTPTTWSDLSTDIFDVIMTIPATTYFEENIYD